MRTIKMRAWDVRDKVMKPVKTYHQDTGKVEFDNDTWDWYRSDRIVMQYTGLTDRNGKEIYEGDIVQRHNDNPFRMKDGTLKYCSWKVEWRYDGWDFINTPISPAASWPSFYSNAPYMEIIGNIYEHPHLLES